MFGDKDKPKKKKSMFGGLGEIAGALTGDAKPHHLADHKGMLAAKATIVADEGYGMAENSAKVALQHQTYIVDVHPGNGTDPAFRAEVQCWVSWPGMPKVGDAVPAGYKPGKNDVVLMLGDDKRFNWLQQRSSKEMSDAQRRQALLNAPPDSKPPK
jgi:hypothetical protein